MDASADSANDQLTQYAIQLSIQESIEAVNNTPPQYNERFLLPSQENRQIVESIRQGEVFTLQQLIKHKFAFDEADERGWFPLHEAAVQPIQQVLEIVLDSSYNTIWQQRTEDGETPLTLAATAGILGNVQTLLEKRICPNVANNRGETPLLIAVKKNSLEMASVLLQHGALINRPCVRRWTAMHEAAKQGHDDMMALLLRNNGSVNQKDGYGVTPVATAAAFGHCSVLEHLIHKGGDIHVQADDGASVLFEAAEGGNPDCITVLLEYGANPNEADNSGHLPIHRAAQKGHYLALKLLIFVTRKSAIRRSGISPIHSAADGGNAQCLELLIESGFDVNALLDEEISESYDDKRRTALFIAVSNNDVACTELLLKGGALPNRDPLSSLLVAVRAGNHELVNLLLHHGANVNSYFLLINDTHFPTAIQYAVNDEMMLRLLLNNGYNVQICFDCVHSDNFGRFLPWPMIEPKSYITSFCEFITVSWLSHLVGRVVRVLIDYVDYVSFCVKLKPVLEKQKEWPEIRDIMENPRCLKHLCRLKIRKHVGQRRLQNRACLALLPLPPVLVEYILYKEYDLYGRGLDLQY
ncbi:ankyrin repeat and SOCS box protein 15-like isoform X1 [Stegostoma tigrinum]|uniref:ankyrin repeat and SOCS box protein 15-like isoform X1 n=1 Tax=Stegostoma tigrinum TaxID=3053191 RepID=UPI00202B98AD|nr:ankyrin repeat and SOCS box protein 15-like isoform X1 [Stegostoma tigrinum]XP_048405159.1 ankyrin repeat and SOCS box protein 15-like isoform X1 [Stegostoma tigrinum]